MQRKLHSRFSFLQGLLGLACAALLSCCVNAKQCQTPNSPAPSAGPSTPTADLMILHVNDTHSYVAGTNERGNYCVDAAQCRGGLARIAAAIQAARARGENVLALDAGDVFQGTLFFSVHRWPMLAELESKMPFDAATLGNHEFDDGCAELEGYLSEIPFPVLAANISAATDTPLARAGIAPYMVRNIGGHKVGVIGLANDGASILPGACPGMRFVDREKALKSAVKALTGRGVQRIVLVTHLGLSEDRQLARSVDGVDVIVGGHTHSYLGKGAEEGPYPIVEKSPSGQPVLVVTAGAATRYLGELSVNFDDKGVPRSWSGQARELGQEAPRDPGLERTVATYAGALEEFRKTVVGSHNITMNDGLDGCRRDECLGGLLFTDAMLDYGRSRGARIALINSGNMRASFPPGQITQGDILNAFPFAGQIVLREYSGAQVLAALEHGVSGREEDKRVGGPRMLQVAGLRYTVDCSREPGKRVLRAELLDEKGRPSALEPKKQYIVALSEYLVKGGDGYAMLNAGRRIEAPDPIDSDLLTDYVRRHSPLKVEPGRLVLKNQ